MDPLISIQNLTFGYPCGKRVLDGITLDIYPGEIFGIIGASGAGKSTLMHHLNGINRGEGQITVAGRTIGRAPDHEIRGLVGLVFQNPEDQLFCPTVAEDIAFGLINQGLDAAAVQQRIDRILGDLQISAYRDQPSQHLSFGEKKKVALATVLAMAPEVICLDEPFANLDYASVFHLIDLIRSLPQTRIIVSQEILLSLSVCHRLAVLKEGRLLKVAPAAVIAADHALLEEAGLDYRPFLRLIEHLGGGEKENTDGQGQARTDTDEHDLKKEGKKRQSFSVINAGDGG
jgi:cobalt/nickel transport system ATP-binding protein